MHEINKSRAAQLLQSFASEDEIIQKSEENQLDLIEKAGPRAVIGEKRIMGGREYIKTATGWKYHGKGTGTTAQSHVAAAGVHHTERAVSANRPPEDAAAKHDHSSKQFEDAPEGHKHQVGDPVKVHNGITDPVGKQGLTGTVVHSDDEKANVRFPDGNLGSYQHNTLKKVKGEAQTSQPKEDFNLTPAKLRDIETLTRQEKEIDNDIRGTGAQYAARRGNTKEKLSEVRAKLKKLTQVKDMSLFISRPDLQYYLSPGPMKISEDHPHEIYSFGKKSEGNQSYFNVPTDEGVKAKKQGRLDTLNQVRNGTVYHWVPGGYHLGVKFSKTSTGNTKVEVIGRPSSAVGKSPLIKEYEMRGWNINSQRNEVAKYDQKHSRDLLQSVHGKEIKWV
jgi:hypothetical protein